MNIAADTFQAAIERRYEMNSRELSQEIAERIEYEYEKARQEIRP